MAWPVVEDVLGCPAVMSSHGCRTSRRKPPVTWPQISQLFGAAAAPNLQIFMQQISVNCRWVALHRHFLRNFCTWQFGSKTCFGRESEQPSPTLGRELGWSRGLDPGHRPIPRTSHTSHTYHSHLAGGANNILFIEPDWSMNALMWVLKYISHLLNNTSDYWAMGNIFQKIMHSRHK